VFTPFCLKRIAPKQLSLVVEGGIHRYAIQAPAEEFKGSSYKRTFTTGGPVEGNGGYVNDYQTPASVERGGFKEPWRCGRSDSSVAHVQLG
jgi:hypothetical protein